MNVIEETIEATLDSNGQLRDSGTGPLLAIWASTKVA